MNARQSCAASEPTVLHCNKVPSTLQMRHHVPSLASCSMWVATGLVAQAVGRAAATGAAEMGMETVVAKAEEMAEAETVADAAAVLVVVDGVVAALVVADLAETRLVLPDTVLTAGCHGAFPLVCQRAERKTERTDRCSEHHMYGRRRRVCGEEERGLAVKVA